MTMFKPDLTIELNPDLKTYSISASVWVPNGCYVQTGASHGTPPKGQQVTPETEPVVLRTFKRDGPCTEGVKELTYIVPNIPLTDGKTDIVAYTVLDNNDQILGATRKSVPEPSYFSEGNFDQAKEFVNKPEKKSGARITTVNAWVNAMPPGPRKLIVNIGVYAPCLNYSFKTIDLGPWGIAGTILRVGVEATKPENCDKGIFDDFIRFESDWEDDDKYTVVWVEFEDQMIMDGIEIIH